MVSKVCSIGLEGLDGYVIEVETDTRPGMESKTDVVGLPDASVKEAMNRVRSAIYNNRFRIPECNMVTNLAPASIKKEGTVYDLPILLGILISTGQLPAVNPKAVFIGELSLTGELRPCFGVLASVISAKNRGFEEIFVPAQNADEGAVIEGINVYPVENISELAEHIRGENLISPVKRDISQLKSAAKASVSDFSLIVGQHGAKRACEIAAAGGHNIMLIGPPGTGKSMIAKSLPSILPEMTFDEMIECSKVYSIAGKLTKEMPLVLERPFIKSNQNVSMASMTGGGSSPTPGLISLAHNGVLFLDEVAEFSTRLLETLRQPLEDNSVTVNRVKRTVTFPSAFMLVCAMNPCPCGNYGHPTLRCTCTPQQVERYMNKISGPLLDRIDLQVEMPPVPLKEIKSARLAETSAEIKKRVDVARQIQQERYKGESFNCNAKMSSAAIRKYCNLTDKAMETLTQVFERTALSMRAYDKLIKIGRTIADLEGKETVEAAHISEAVFFRSLDKKYWNRTGV
ncbi:MAG: YifB family Mg chelatase-like AAA ATPase [Clostridia bacterium]|nr:YifB family Mg chelatase-like AAA ATPase [Clostridia bacterium]